MNRTVTTAIRDNLGILTLDNPDQRNPLATDTMKDTTDALRELSASAEVGCIILKANGTVFSAGHDLKERSAAPWRMNIASSRSARS